MTAIAPGQATGPIRTTTTRTAAPTGTRRRLTIAALGRRARRRATWIHHQEPRTVELPLIALITGAAGVAAVTLAVLGVFELLASAVLS